MHYHDSPANETTASENTRFKGWIQTNRTKFTLLSASLLAVLISLLISFAASDADAASVCDRYASSKGSNSNPGTVSKPYRSAQKLADTLQPGQRGCLRAGVYTEGDKQVLLKRGGTSNKQRLIMQNYPGERATIKAQVKVDPGANYVTFRSAGGLWNLTLDGTEGRVDDRPTNQGRYSTRQSPLIHANNTRWVGLNITKRNWSLSSTKLYKTGVCAHIGDSDIAVRNTAIIKNRIHGCGVKKGQHDESYIRNYFGQGKNLDNRRSGSPDNHGIYVSNASGAIIRDNLIYSNGERGIQLYPNSRGVIVKGNVVDGNGQGLVVDAKSSNNMVRGNVFSSPQYGWNVYQGPKLSGTGNRVNSNCFWVSKRTSGFKNGDRISASNNVVAAPRYQDRRNFKITNRACLAKYSGTLARR